MRDCDGFLFSDHALKAMITRRIQSVEIEEVVNLER